MEKVCVNIRIPGIWLLNCENKTLLPLPKVKVKHVCASPRIPIAFKYQNISLQSIIQLKVVSFSCQFQSIFHTRNHSYVILEKHSLILLYKLFLAFLIEIHSKL